MHKWLEPRINNGLYKRKWNGLETRLCRDPTRELRLGVSAASCKEEGCSSSATPFSCGDNIVVT